LQDYPRPDPSVCRFALDSLKKAGYVLTLFQEEYAEESEEIVDLLKELYCKYVGEKVPDSLDDLLDGLLIKREQARENKEYDVADSIRDEIECLGFEIQDTAEGPVWRKRK
jgi:cysteinyl-tRNA synthetase